MRRLIGVAGGLVVAATIFCVTGELLARAFDVVDRLNGYSRLLYARGDVPTLPYGLRPGVTTRLLGAEVRVNAAGFRGPDIAPKPAGGVTRVLVLGDSVVFGFGVGEDETLAAALQRDLDAWAPGAYEVLNLGVPGYNTAAEVELLEARGLALAPGIVVLGVSLNDFESVPAYGSLGVLTRSGGGLAGRSELALLLRWLWGWARGDLWQQVTAGTQGDRHLLDRAVEQGHVAFYRDPPPAAWHALEAAWTRLAALAATHRLRVLVAIFPESHQLGPDARGGEAQRRLLGLCERARLRCLDLRPSFAAAGGELFQEAQHPNARGFAVAAAAIEASLRHAARGAWASSD